MINAGALWLDEALVVDGHLISSRTPKDLPVFAKALVEQLRGDRPLPWPFPQHGEIHS